MEETVRTLLQNHDPLEGPKVDPLDLMKAYKVKTKHQKMYKHIMLKQWFYPETELLQEAPLLKSIIDYVQLSSDGALMAPSNDESSSVFSEVGCEIIRIGHFSLHSKDLIG